MRLWLRFASNEIAFAVLAGLAASSAIAIAGLPALLLAR